jgi:hypothetical protein
MPRRTHIEDIQQVDFADELEDVVQDKRAGWRANAAKARRRQRRYKNRLTQALAKSHSSDEEWE